MAAFLFYRLLIFAIIASSNEILNKRDKSMNNSKWLKIVKKVMVFFMSTEIFIKHIISWRVNDNMLIKYKSIYPYLYRSKSSANQFMYNHVFFKSVVDEASEKAKKILYKINPHKYWQMKP